jgi:hypothetical protein
VFRENGWGASGRSSSSSNGGGDARKGVWKKLWKLACSGKIKHFSWRLYHNSLAVRTSLIRHGMVLDTRCMVCYRLDEDGGISSANASTGNIYGRN